jgi:hypothetical protein
MTKDTAVIALTCAMGSLMLLGLGSAAFAVANSDKRDGVVR